LIKARATTYNKKLKIGEIAFILQTQEKVKAGAYTYLGMTLSEANLKLIEDHKKTEGYQNYVMGQRKLVRVMEKAREQLDGLSPLIKFQEKVQKITDKFRHPVNNPINMGIGSLPNPFGATMTPSRVNVDEEGDYVSQIQPVLHKRRPTTGVGITGYMQTRGLTNPVEISKEWLNDFGLTITGFKNIKYLCREMNVTSGEAFKYICEGMNKNPKRYRHHRVTMEMFRGSMAVVDLITLYKNKIAEHKKSNKFKYTQEQLYHSDEFKNFCTTHGITFKTFKTFHAWWLEINKLHKAEAVKRPKGLLG
jgi:hypothetical protein